MRILPNKRGGVKEKVGQAFLPVPDSEQIQFLKTGVQENGQAGMPVLLQHPGEFFEIVNKATMFQATGFIIRRAKN